MALRNIPTNLILGFLGVGKTTAICHLLAHRPDGERWAVLVNEFGQVGVDGALLEQQGVAVAEVAGGCICCVAGAAMQVGLNRPIREARPDRLLIEPTGLGHPQQILQSLLRPPFDELLELRATLGLVDARKLTDPRYTTHETFIDQLQLADLLLANKADLYDEAAREAFVALVRAATPPKALSAWLEFGRVSPLWLDLPRAIDRNRRSSRADGQPANVVEAATDRCAAAAEAGWFFLEGVGDGFYSGGWRIAARQCFARVALERLCRQPGVERIKGVMHTDAGWLELNAADGELAMRPARPLLESRIEFIGRRRLAWRQIEQALLAGLWKA